jgi:N6-adenosine-specific RNA methylase IME4
MFEGLNPPYAAILADPPWSFEVWSDKGKDRSPDYQTMSLTEIVAMPVESIATKDSVLFLWVTWPLLEVGLQTIIAWGFTYKTCAFAWIKADTSQLEMFRDDADADMLLGYWTRSNSEVCLLGTRGKPHRVSAGVRQGIIEPRREHSRKPSCVHSRIERLVEGPYLELFARSRRAGWDAWGNEVDKFNR